MTDFDHRPGLGAPGELGADPSRRPTRPPMETWDRLKLLLLGFLLFWFFVWSEMSDNPLLAVEDAVNDTLRSKWWLLVLGWLEAVRQAHFLVSEHSSAYHRFWSRGVFGRWNRRVGRLNDWNRFRVARALKVLVAIAVLSVVLGSAFDVPPVTALFELPSRAWEWLPLVAQVLSLAMIVVLQFVALFWFLSRGGVDTYFPDDIDTRFQDVWGQDAVVDRVKENMVFLDDPDAIEAKGGYVPQGILLWGPPGTGKTLMAEAVAGETGKPFVFVEPGAFQAMFMGIGILKVKSLFRRLRKLAVRYGGVIVFFDEADSLGNRGQLAGVVPGGGPVQPAVDDHLRWLSEPARAEIVRQQFGRSTSAEPERRRRDGFVMGMGGGGGGMGTLQALLTELSGLKKPRGLLNRYARRLVGMRPKPPPKYRILVMMATNMPEALDEALLRPGRLDRIYKVGYPSKEGRERTYRGYFDRVDHELTDEDIEKLATITPYATGAMAKDLVNEALINAIRDGRDVITWADVIEAKHLKELGPPEDVEYVERERHAVAVHEACHAVAAYHVRRHLQIDLATIEKGGTYLGMVSSIRPEDRFTHWRSEYEADIVVALASLAGERLFFEGDNSSGVAGDLQAATTIATFMEGYWGMGSTVASHGVTHQVGIGGGRPVGTDGEDDRQLLGGDLGARIEEKLAELLDRAEDLLQRHAPDVLALAHALETRKTLSGEDVVAVIERSEGPVIDGRVYADEAFMRELRDYHVRAFKAHAAHDRVAIPLPSGHGRTDGVPVLHDD